MRIGEVAKRTGFSTDTIRWYEKIGLIELDRKSRTENNYRQYDAGTVEKLMHIKKIKSFGFTLKEVENLLLLDETNLLNCSSVSTLVDKKLDTIARKIQELQLLQQKIIHVKDTCQGNCKAVLVA